MKKRPIVLAIGFLVGLAGGSGCRASAAPEQSFADAENLRLKYEKGASLQAITKYQAALADWTRQGNKRDAAKASRYIARTYEQLGALKESLRRYVEALTLSKELNDPLFESDVRSDVGMAHARLGEFDEALLQCQEASKLAERAHGARERARALNCLGEVDYHRGNSASALALYRRAERLWIDIADQRGRAETLLFLGSAHADLNELDAANKYLQLSLPIWTELADKRGQVLTDLALTRLLYLPGEYQEALNRLIGLRDTFQAAGDTVWEAACLSNIAYVYEQMGEARSALRYWEAASDLFGAAGLQMAALEMFVRIGTSYLVTDVSTALTWFDKARTVAEASGNQHMQSWALRYTGVAYLALGDSAKAVDYLERSLNLQRSVGDPRFRGRTLADLGKTQGFLGDHPRALAYFNQALALSSSSGDRVGEAMALFGLARTSAGLNDLAGARRYIESALSKAESLRTDVENRDLRTSYFASIHQYHELYLDVLMRLNKLHPGKNLAATAFAASERARARSLLDSLTEARIDFRKDMQPELLKREQVVLKEFDDWAERQRVGGSSARNANAKALAAEYRSLEERYDLVQAEIRSKSPHYAAFARPRPLTLNEVQRQVLDDTTILLEFALGEERSYLWVVSNRLFTSYELPPRATIERAALRVYERLTARLTVTGDPEDRRRLIEQADADYWIEAALLSDMLFGQVAEKITGKRLLLVTDGALQYLPFAALPVPGGSDIPVPMVVKHEIVNLPSASVLAVLRQETAGAKPTHAAVAVLADPVFEATDPRLPTLGSSAGRSAKKSTATANSEALTGEPSQALRGAGFMRDGTLRIPRLIATGQEADDIIAAAHQGSSLKAVGFNASRRTAMSADLTQYRIVHFATHGVFNNEDPGLSGIILSMFDERGQPQNGFLRLHDIYSLKLPAELVVLSACNTALGKPVKGEGLVGMVRGFMYAGAKRVVASYWKVDDEATGALMSRFYLEMLQQNRSPAAALRQAQLEMIRHDRWRPPFYWAAFVLQGEWK